MPGSEQRFLEAAALGDLAGVQAELTAGVSVDRVDDSGLTALLLASQKGRTSVVQFLVGQADADLTAIGPGGNTALLLAAGNGHLPVVQFLVHQGVSIEQKNDNQMTALLLASENNHFPVVEFLINQYPYPIFVNTVNTYIKYSALVYAIRNRNRAFVTYLVGKGANVNHIDAYGTTPLDHAVDMNELGIVIFLLASGANPRLGIPLIVAMEKDAAKEIVELLVPLVDINKSRPEPGTTALLRAVQYKKAADYVDLLLTHGANPNIQMSDGLTPLITASATNSRQIVQTLLSHGANPLLTMTDGKCALHTAVATQDIDMVTTLLPYFPTVDVSMNDGATPFMLSLLVANISENIIESNGFPIATLLLSKGANINNQQVTTGRTVLHFAIEKKRQRIINFLLSPAHFQLAIPLQLDIQDSEGWTALHRAIQATNPGVTKQLLSLGADPTLRTNNNQSPLTLAAQFVNSLAEYGLVGPLMDVNTPDGITLRSPPLVMAASLGKATIVKELLNMGANINLEDNKFNTALLVATREGHAAVVNELLSNPRRLPDLEATTPERETALLLAIKLYRIAIAQQLLGASANLEAQDAKGRTPLLQATIYNVPILVSELLQRGANIEHADINGETALLQAVAKGYLTIVNMLIEKKANASHLTENGNTPLLIALVTKKDLPLTTLLLSTNPDLEVICGFKPKITYLTYMSSIMENPFVRILLEKGADPNHTILNPTGGESPLSLASKMNFHSTVDILISAGASVNLPIDAEGLTALTRLFIKKASNILPHSRVHMVKHLIAKGADIRQQFVAGPHKGLDALAFARAQGVEPGILQVLEEKEAELKVADLRGQALGTIKAGLVANGKLVPNEGGTRRRRKQSTRRKANARRFCRSRKF